MSMALISYKYQIIEIIKIVYEKAAESDDDKNKELKEVINKIHEKYNLFSNMFIQEIISFLPYETEYNNWQQAMEYIERLIKEDKARKQ